jgi:hypothetical protein
VERPREAVAFAKEQGAILPFQHHKAGLGLNNEGLAEWLEVQNNPAGNSGITWTSGDETHKCKAPEAEGKKKHCHRRPPRKVGENAQIDAVVTLGRL